MVVIVTVSLCMLCVRGRGDILCCRRRAEVALHASCLLLLLANLFGSHTVVVDQEVADACSQPGGEGALLAGAATGGTPTPAMV